jgi:hypothetical protein
MTDLAIAGRVARPVACRAALQCSRAANLRRNRASCFVLRPIIGLLGSAVLVKGEVRLDFIREAVDRELERRQRVEKKPARKRSR